MWTHSSMSSCDTFVVLGTATSDGRVLVGKNSDREPNEPNNLFHVPAQDHPPHSSVACTYLTIPQVAHTHALLLQQPSWLWGAEYGSNSHGVCIGNEALFSSRDNGGGPRSPALLGMDLVRLGLERGSSAEEARDVIIELLETHGQGGNCGLSQPFYYNNAFIVADRRHAYIIETYHRFWVWKRVAEFGAISNAYSIGTDWDMAAPALLAWVEENQLVGTRLNFSGLFGGRNASSVMGQGAKRCRQVRQRLECAAPHVNVQICMSILRLHDPGVRDYNPADLFQVGRQTVCMHYAGPTVRKAQTTGSVISHLALPAENGMQEDQIVDVHWVTGTSAPCLSVYKPIAGVQGLPYDLMSGQFFVDSSWWWKGEHLHRLVLHDFTERATLVRARCHQIELEALEEFSRFGDRVPVDQVEKYWKPISLRLFDQSYEMMEELVNLFQEKERKSLTQWRWGTLSSLVYLARWRTINQEAFASPLLRYWTLRLIPVELVTSVFLLLGYAFFRRWKQ